MLHKFTTKAVNRINDSCYVVNHNSSSTDKHSGKYKAKYNEKEKQIIMAEEGRSEKIIYQEKSLKVMLVNLLSLIPRLQQVQSQTMNY